MILAAHVCVLVFVVDGVGVDLADEPPHALLLLVHLGGPQDELDGLVRDIALGKRSLAVARIARSSPAGFNSLTITIRHGNAADEFL